MLPLIPHYPRISKNPNNNNPNRSKKRKHKHQHDFKTNLQFQLCRHSMRRLREFSLRR
ncbi:hypothetical protein QJS10_CPA09g01403 [Acorus calamus]|uniref:Uncharacterized protein n=1 Tax=Acorus calamus TaxID=4465 RepID=A0AAV9E4D3_ACOCL|nr:hypothetical protein QJS10_CPA09g01403 [Acorus calamus]